MWEFQRSIKYISSRVYTLKNMNGFPFYPMRTLGKNTRENFVSKNSSLIVHAQLLFSFKRGACLSLVKARDGFETRRHLFSRSRFFFFFFFGFFFFSSKANFSDATCGAAPVGNLVSKNTNNNTNSGTSRVSRSSGRIIPRGMAWRSHGTDNDSLVNALVRNRVLKTRKVIDAMRRVDRGNYCVPFSGQSAYEDHPLPIGSNATISAPHMHAACLELVHDRVTENARVLDVGSGSGYLTSCFAAMLDQHDSYAAGSIRAEEVEDRRPGLSDTKYPIVVGVEHIKDLVDFSIENTKKDGKGKYLQGPEPLVVLKVADGREGYPPYAPYDVIHVGAASPEKPTKLLKQLANGGRLVCPVGRGWQSLRVYDKDDKGRVTEFDAMGVTYVPLTGAKEQMGRASASSGSFW